MRRICKRAGIERSDFHLDIDFPNLQTTIDTRDQDGGQGDDEFEVTFDKLVSEEIWMHRITHKKKWSSCTAIR
jgi:hypothetical protein